MWQLILLNTILFSQLPGIDLFPWLFEDGMELSDNPSPDRLRWIKVLSKSSHAVALRILLSRVFHYRDYANNLFLLKRNIVM